MEFYYLKRIQASEKLLIPLKKNEIVIGRGKDCTYQIVDESISRSHVLIKKCDSGWTLKNLSSNGLYLNDKLAKKNDEISLFVGNVIRLGHSENFSFRFGMKEKLHMRKPFKQKELEGKYEDDDSTNLKENKMVDERFLKSLVEENQIQQKLVITELESKLKMEEDRKFAILQDKEELSMRLQIEKMNLERRLIQERKELEYKLSVEKEELHNKLLKLEEERKRTEEEAKCREMFLKTKEKEREDMFEQHVKELSNLKEEKGKLAQRLGEVEANLEEKVLLTSTLEEELVEKEKIDKRLEALLEEKRVLARNFEDAVEKGAQVPDLEESLKKLESQKSLLEQELASVSSVSEIARKEVLESVSAALENELQCPICNELFITAMMLNCSHTFCKYCIDSWKKNKKDCPNCREKITSETRSLVVDNFIEKIINTMSDDLKQQRNQIIAERTAEIKAARESEVQIVGTSTGNFRGRGRGRGGRQHNRRARGRGATTRGTQRTSAFPASNSRHPPFNAAVFAEGTSVTTSSISNLPPDVPSSSDSESSLDHDSLGSYGSDSSSDYGDPGAYYGGYGRCYICGSRGHWSNGCPYR